MNKQKFQVGDRVRVRRFDEIDADDIGNICYGELTCYAISRDVVDQKAELGGSFTITRVSTYDDAWVYRIWCDRNDRDCLLWWAQGMLDFANTFNDALPEPDHTGLFSFLVG